MNFSGLNLRFEQQKLCQVVVNVLKWISHRRLPERANAIPEVPLLRAGWPHGRVGDCAGGNPEPSTVWLTMANQADGHILQAPNRSPKRLRMTPAANPGPQFSDWGYNLTLVAHYERLSIKP
jgi:hypothetical protein